MRLSSVGRTFSLDGIGYLLDPGSMWREPELDSDGRECWAVVLPNGRVWRTTDQGDDGGFWTVSGTPPHISVSPSIEDPDPDGSWHGSITGGEFVT
jgi:hypothetical protein